MARFQRVSLVDVRSVPPTHPRELVDWSYRHARAALPKARQAARRACCGKLPRDSAARRA